VPGRRAFRRDHWERAIEQSVADFKDVAGRRFAPAEAERYPPKLLRRLERATDRRHPELRFPEPAEGDYRRHARQESRVTRLILCVLMAGLCLLAPRLDAELGPGVLAAAANPMQSTAYFLLLPWWLAGGVVLLKWPSTPWGARLIWLAALLQVSALQILGARGYVTDAVPPVLMAVLSLMAVLVLGRFRFVDALGLIATYFAFMGLFNGIFDDGPQHESLHWLLEGLGFTILLLGGFWNEMSSRRAWAAQMLLHAAAGTDFLTGMFNRRAFEHYFHRISLQAQRQACPLVLAVIDVDHFKGYNDTHGHPAGDRALNQLGRVLRDFARRSLDTAARVGGEEFALVLFDCRRQQAVERLEVLRCQVETLSKNMPEGLPGGFTISIGAAEVNGLTGLDRAYAQADEQLYRAKRAGRNQLMMAGIEDL